MVSIRCVLHARSVSWASLEAALGMGLAHWRDRAEGDKQLFRRGPARRERVAQYAGCPALPEVSRAALSHADLHVQRGTGVLENGHADYSGTVASLSGRRCGYCPQR